MNVCSIAGCGKPVYARGWCNAHWTRNRRWGDPLGSGSRKRQQDIHEAEDGSLYVIANNNGMTIRFDREDRDVVEEFTWSALKVGPTNWYAVTTFKAEKGERSGPRVYMHSLLAPPLRDGRGWDHANGDGLDNRRANVRPATVSQNQANRRKPKTINGKAPSSQYLGVTKIHDDRWKMTVRSGDRQYASYHTTEEEAARAYDDKKVELHGEFARLNFPDE